MEDAYYSDYLDFFSKRIGELRIAKDVSAREVSLAIGKDSAYISKIESKKFLPSMETFYGICDYFKISQKDFFDDGVRYPEKLQAIIEKMNALNDEQLVNIDGIISAIVKK